MTDDKDKRGEDLEGSLLGLPETETELDVRFHMEILKWGFISGIKDTLLLFGVPLKTKQTWQIKLRFIKQNMKFKSILRY